MNMIESPHSTSMYTLVRSSPFFRPVNSLRDESQKPQLMPLDTRINYNRFSLSLVYMISDKINKKPSRDRRVGGRR